MTITKRHAKLAREFAAEHNVSYMQALREVDNRDAAAPPSVARREGEFFAMLYAKPFQAPFDIRTLWPDACIEVPFDPKVAGRFTIHENASGSDSRRGVGGADFGDGALESANGLMPGEPEWEDDPEFPDRMDSVPSVDYEPVPFELWGEAFSAYLVRDAAELIEAVETVVSDWASDEDERWAQGVGGGDPVMLPGLRVSIPGKTAPREPRDLSLYASSRRDRLGVDYSISGDVAKSDFNRQWPPLPSATIVPTGEGEGLRAITDLNLDWTDERRRAAVAYMLDESRHLMGQYALERHTWERLLAKVTGLPVMPSVSYELDATPLES